MPDTKTRKLQRQRHWKLEVVSTFDDAEEQSRAFWRSASPADRLNALEELREQLYGPDQASRRLQRFLEVVPQQQG